MDELIIVYQSLQRPSIRPASCHQHFQTSSLKQLGQLNFEFHTETPKDARRKFVQMVLVTWPGWPPRLYVVKTLKKSSPEPEGG